MCITSVSVWWDDLYLEISEIGFHLEIIIFGSQFCQIGENIHISPDENEEDDTKSNIADIAEDMVEVSKCLNLRLQVVSITVLSKMRRTMLN